MEFKIRKMEKNKLNEISDYRNGKNDFLKSLKNKEIGISIEELGLTEEQVNDRKYWHRVEEDEIQNFSSHISGSTEFRVIPLYKYVSNIYGGSNVGPNTRDFCRRLVNRTSTNLLRFSDITLLNNAQPGMGQGGSNSYSVFNWRGGKNCKHIWVKFLMDTTTGNLVEAPLEKQPPNLIV